MDKFELATLLAGLAIVIAGTAMMMKVITFGQFMEVFKVAISFIAGLFAGRELSVRRR